MKFIVVGLPKTGKTMICDCLNSLDGFTVYDEIFLWKLGFGNMPDHPLPFMNEIRKRNRRNSFIAWYQKKYKKQYESIQDIVEDIDIDQFLNHTFLKNSNVGFKLHHHHIETFPYIKTYIKHMQIKVIHTRRRDSLKQAVAILGNRDRITHNRIRINLSFNIVQDTIHDIEWRTRDLTRWFDGLTLYYEDLTQDKHIDELDVSSIGKYLQVDMPSLVKVRTVKNTYSEVKDNVINHEDLNELSKN